MMPAISSASCGQSMRGHCWWASSPSFQETTSGVWCWHIYRGHEDAVHCLPYMLASWDCQERVEVLCQEGRLGSMWSGQRRASRPRRRSRSSSRCHSRTPAQGDWSGHSCSSSPNMPSRCHCGAPLSLGADTMPKLASAVNVPSYARSSHSLNDEDVWEDDLQTPHMPNYCIVWWDEGCCRERATERMEASRGSPGVQPYYQVDIGEEEAETLESIDPNWRTTH